MSAYRMRARNDYVMDSVAQTRTFGSWPTAHLFVWLYRLSNPGVWFSVEKVDR